MRIPNITHVRKASRTDVPKYCTKQTVLSTINCTDTHVMRYGNGYVKDTEKVWQGFREKHAKNVIILVIRKE